jgi:hypothetical protein
MQKERKLDHEDRITSPFEICGTGLRFGIVIDLEHEHSEINPRK